MEKDTKVRLFNRFHNTSTSVRVPAIWADEALAWLEHMAHDKGDNAARCQLYRISKELCPHTGFGPCGCSFEQER